MIRLYLALTLGHFRKHRLEFLLCLLGVALGVAVVVAIESAVNACVSSFSGAVESLAERSTHSIFAQTGSITDQQYIDLLKRRLPVPLAPMIDRGVLISLSPADSIVARLIGIDVFSERNLRSFTQFQSSLDESSRQVFLTQPNQVVLVDALAKRAGVKTGDILRLVVGDRRVDVHICGVVEMAGVARAHLSDLIFADLATAQELTNSLGTIDRIDTHLDNPQQVQLLTAALPPGLELRSTSQQSSSLDELIASYRMNLGALSLMASFVAVFIVYNSMLVSVQQRAKSLGVLRCLGAGRLQLGGLYVAEALLFAAIGALLGVLVGWLLSRLMVGYISTTINDLYATVRPHAVSLGWGMIAKGAAVSFVSCLLGAMVPLYQASQMPPVNAFRPTERHRASGPASLRLLVIGSALLAASWGVYRLPGNSPGAGFVMALLIATGFALMCPWLARIASSAVQSIARRLQFLPMQMAAAAVGRSLGITGVAVAATMLAMAMNISVRTMVWSFRTALTSWMQQRFSADIFVGPELLVKHRLDSTLSPAVIDWINSQPEIDHIVRFRTREIQIQGKSTTLVATDIHFEIPSLQMKSAIGPMTEFNPKTDVLISEPLAGRDHLAPGDSLTLDSPTGPQVFRVFAIFYDFGNERGQTLIDLPTFIPLWHDTQINSLHVMVHPGSDHNALAARWSATLRANYPVVIDSSQTVKSEVLTIFDRTFAVTEVLTWLAGAVAFCGLAGSLLALALARQRDYSVLVAVGMTARQTITWVLGQGLVIAWCAALVACAAGTILAFVLAYVIQYRSFGWSIPTSAQPRFWLENLALATAAAAVAAVYPALRLRRSPPAGGLRQE
ncbi:MAG: ABC transporter permease [Planctomycetota bacterium]|nr:ABC transporter permease [Planctomycetota bacterium]